ncbi:MAG: hypothetical protein DRJ41_00355 [Thermoprotei archaeon]|nr:MAG: hypothetical protein DRJ41_00355 [Thermoprotei archaeon]
MRKRKVRFGISIPENLAEELTRLSIALKTDRSSLVAEALEDFLHEKTHILNPHLCEGVLVIAYQFENRGCITEVLKLHDDLVVTRTHVHSNEGYCVELVYTRGLSENIRMLEAELRRVGVLRVKYLACEINK